MRHLLFPRQFSSIRILLLHSNLFQIKGCLAAIDLRASPNPPLKTFLFYPYYLPHAFQNGSLPSFSTIAASGAGISGLAAGFLMQRVSRESKAVHPPAFESFLISSLRLTIELSIKSAIATSSASRVAGFTMAPYSGS